MKTRYSIRNAIIGVIYILTTIVMGILSRRAIVLILGIEYQGVDGLFSNVITMLSIAELGIGSAIIYHLYKPLVDNDIETIISLMLFYKKCYRVIALIIAIIGLAISPILPHIVKDYNLAYPIFSIYIWFLLDSVFSYVLSYRRSILMADQKNYILSLSDTLYTIVTKLVQILILWETHNFIYSLIAMALFRLLENIAIYYITNKKYPYLINTDAARVSDDIYNDIQLKVKGAICHKIGTFVVLGTDNILISKFLGLAISGIYSNYYLIINALQSISSKIVTSATASIGHLLTNDDPAKDFEIFNELQLINVFLTNCAAAGLYCTATPVITLFFGEEFTITKGTLLVLTINFCMQCMRSVYSSFKEAAGILYEDRWVPLIESSVNIIASLLFMKFFGLAGVFLGTITSSIILYAYTYPVLIYKGVLHQKYSSYVRDWTWQFALFIITMLSCSRICQTIHIESQIVSIIAIVLICILIPLTLSLLGYAVWRSEMKSLLNRIKYYVKH